MDYNNKKIPVNHKNKGFTLMELLIVVAIMAIMTGLTIIAVSILATGDSKKASKNLLNELEALKVDTMSIDGEWWAEVYINSSGTYTVDVIKKNNGESTVYETKTLGSRLSISYHDNGVGNITKDLSVEDTKLKIFYEKGSGKISSVTIVENGAETAISTGLSSKGEFIIKPKGKDTQSVLTLYYRTGKIVTDY